MIFMAFVVIFMAFSWLAVTESVAFAEGGAGLPWEDALDKVMNSIKGPVALGVSVIAIVAAGAALVFGGDMQGFMRTSAYLALAIGLIIAATNVLQTLYGKGMYVPQDIPAIERTENF